MPSRKPASAALPPSRVSLRDVARLTGFSVTTVSLVLNGRASRFRISAATRDLVRRAAQEHGYHPNLHARGLRSATSDLVGLMVPTLRNPFFNEMAETFERLARGDGKLALIAVTHYDPREELDTLRWFLGQRVACVFTANVTAQGAVSALCSGAGTRHVLLDSAPGAKHTVSTDNRGAALALTRDLLASLAAARRPGRLYFVGGSDEHQITRHRLEGFQAALRERGLPFAEEQFLATRFDADLASRRLRTLFRTRSDVGGIFFNAVPALEGLVRVLPEAPLWCRQLHCGVFDYHPIMSLLDLRILILKQDPERMMTKAYDLFSSGADLGKGRTHHIPYEIVSTPSMRALLGRKVRAGAQRRMAHGREPP
jgi:DNA-binding LacI/PurR family transcriptional regulator